MGTAIYYDLEEYFDPEWAAVLSHRWSREQIVATAARCSPLVPQPDSGQGEFKVSYYLSEQAATEVLPNLNQL